MIALTRLSGSVFVLNADLIERVDATPDTVVTLVDGKKYVVREDLGALVESVLAYRGEIVARGARIPESETHVLSTGQASAAAPGPHGAAGSGPRLAVVPGESGHRTQEV